jgi:hypothetical protein
MNGKGEGNASVAHSSGKEPCSDDEYTVVCFQSMRDVDSMRSPELDANSTAQQAIGSSLIIKLNQLPLAERESHFMTCPESVRKCFTIDPNVISSGSLFKGLAKQLPTSNI